MADVKPRLPRDLPGVGDLSRIVDAETRRALEEVREQLARVAEQLPDRRAEAQTVHQVIVGTGEARLEGNDLILRARKLTFHGGVLDRGHSPTFTIKRLPLSSIVPLSGGSGGTTIYEVGEVIRWGWFVPES